MGRFHLGLDAVGNAAVCAKRSQSLVVIVGGDSLLSSSVVNSVLKLLLTGLNGQTFSELWKGSKQRLLVFNSFKIKSNNDHWIDASIAIVQLAGTLTAPKSWSFWTFNVQIKNTSFLLDTSYVCNLSLSKKPNQNSTFRKLHPSSHFKNNRKFLYIYI